MHLNGDKYLVDVTPLGELIESQSFKSPDEIVESIQSAKDTLIQAMDTESSAHMTEVKDSHYTLTLLVKMFKGISWRRITND